MRVKHLIYNLCLIFLFSVYCHASENETFRVKGNIMDANSNPINNCVIEIYFAENGSLLYTRKINGSFEEQFIISPQQYDYNIVISCTDISKNYKTNTHRMKYSNPNRNKLDIGKIVLGN